MIRDHRWIADHIPHQGRMCLLDAVEDCSAERIRCSARSHLDDDHPLRSHDRLGIAIGIEYAAQAMAAHGAMLTPAAGKPRVGYVASVRGVELLDSRLDHAGALEVCAERLSGDETTILYRFSVAAGQRCLLRGRATVVMRAGAIAK